MNIRYDREEDILLIELDPTMTIDHAEHTGPLILHLSPEDRPVLLEILGATDFLSSALRASMRGEYMVSAAS